MLTLMGCCNCISPRRDKYQKNLLWYWVDTKYKGLRTEEDKETLRRQTELGKGATTKVPLGLARPSTKTGGAAPPSESDDDDDEEADDESEVDDGESGSGDDGESKSDDGNDDSPKRKKRPQSKPSKSRKPKRKRDELDEELPDEALALLHACEAQIGLVNGSASIINPSPTESENPLTLT